MVEHNNFPKDMVFTIGEAEFSNFVRWVADEDATIDQEIETAEQRTPNIAATQEEIITHIGRTARLEGRKEEIIRIAETLAKFAEVQPSDEKTTSDDL